MENNIFFKMKKEKFNPDIESKLKNKDFERNNTNFNLSTTIYNPITGIIPNTIKTNDDLKLNKDTSIPQSDIRKLIFEKEQERKNEENSYLPTQTKVVNYQNINISDHNTMKSTIKTTNNDKYNNILGDLKDLGILKY